MSTQSDIDAAREYYDTHSVADKIADAVPGDPAGTSAMSGYSVRLPVEVLNRARNLAAERGMTTGAWLREAIEERVAASVPVDDQAARESAYELMRDMFLKWFAEVLDSYDGALPGQPDSSAPSWKIYTTLRDWNAAHRRDLSVDALIFSAGMQHLGTHSHQESEKPEAKQKRRTNSVKFYDVDPSFVRAGHTVRLKDGVHAARRRRRTIT